MDSQESIHHETKDELLALLADRHRRTVLAYFLESTDDVASLRELSAEISEEYDGDDEDVWIRLHHSVLPRLDAAGVVDYDARSNTVRYRGHQKLEALVGFVADL